jgi:hypothetical protein
MSHRIVLGEGLDCDLEVLAETRLLINAASGGGKSRTIRRLAEQSHGKIQQIIIDSEGEFSTLRERHDFVIAAPHGADCVANPRSAGLLAEKLLTLGVSAVINIFDLKKSSGERKRFVRLFLEAMMASPKSLWHPVLVEIDEAHEYAPEGDESEALGPMVDMASQGRKRGYCMVAATQRLSKLSKDVAAELRNVMIGATVLDVDQKRAADVLGFDVAGRRALRDLESGQFWSFGPALVKAPALFTIGPVQTTHPKVGDRKAMPAPPPTAKIRALLPQLADLPAEAEEKARTEADLRRELATARATITRLERATPTPKVEHVPPKVIEKPILKDSQVKALEQLSERLAAPIGKLTDIVAVLSSAAAGINEQLIHTRRSLAAQPVSASRSVVGALPDVTRGVTGRAQVQKPQRVASDTNGALNGGQRKILNALAELAALGRPQPSRAQLSLFASYGLSGGTGAQNLADLVTAGMVAIPAPGIVELLPAGHEHADSANVPESLDDLHQRVYAKLNGGQRRILEHLVSIYPQEITRASLSEAINYGLSGGTGAQNLADLVTLGAAKIPGPGRVAASSLLFPDSLR